VKCKQTNRRKNSLDNYANCFRFFRCRRRRRFSFLLRFTNTSEGRKPSIECTCTSLASTNSERLTCACLGKRHDSRGVEVFVQFSLSLTKPRRRDVIVCASRSLPKHFPSEKSSFAKFHHVNRSRKEKSENNWDCAKNKHFASCLIEKHFYVFWGRTDEHNVRAQITNRRVGEEILRRIIN
jgi:hypothetical protein